MPTAEELLRTTPIFSRLSPADRKTVAEVSRVQQFGKGDTIFEQDSPSDEDGIVHTEKDGFVVLDDKELARIASG